MFERSFKKKRLWNQFLLQLLKACARYFLTNSYLSPHDSPSKTMEEVFCLI